MPAIPAGTKAAQSGRPDDGDADEAFKSSRDRQVGRRPHHRWQDDFIYREVSLPISSRKIPIKQLLRGEALAAFVEWKHKADKIPY